MGTAKAAIKNVHRHINETRLPLDCFRRTEVPLNSNYTLQPRAASHWNVARKLVGPKCSKQMLTKLFPPAKIAFMQSNKASKKTRKIAEESSTVSPTAGVSGEAATTPRTSRSSKSKSDNTESGPARHRKTSSPVATETSTVENAPAAKTLAASAGAGLTSNHTAPNTSPSTQVSFVAATDVPHDEIATLAHHYWMARSGNDGSAEQDWLRAERELKTKRLAG